MILKSGTKEIKITPLEPTLARYAEFKDSVSKLAQVTDAHGNFNRDVAALELIKKYPDILGDLMDEQGDINQNTLSMKANSYVVRGMSEKEAKAKAANDILDRLKFAAKDNKEIFVTLFAPELSYPTTYASVVLGIDVIKATCDKTKFTASEKKLFESEDFWNNVEWKGVAEYVNSFCRSYK